MSKTNFMQHRYACASRALFLAVALAASAASAAAGCGAPNNPCPAPRAVPGVVRPAAPAPQAVMRSPMTPGPHLAPMRTGVTQIAPPNPHPVLQRAATLPVAPRTGLRRPMPHFFMPGAPGQPAAPVAFEFYRPAAPFTRGVSFSSGPVAGGPVLFGIAVAAPVSADPMALVQYDTVVVASGSDVRQAYVADVGSPPAAVQVVGFNVGASRPVIDRSSNDFMMIKSTGAVVVPDGSQAVATEHLTLYPPGSDQGIDREKPLALAQDGGQFENQFSIPLSSDSPQGEYNYKVQVVVNQQVMGEQAGSFQAL